MDQADRPDRYAHAADAYRRSRPAYPDRAVRLLTNALGLDPGDQIVELGAGTGTFTRQLAAYGCTVTAVEPSEAMRSRIRTTDRITRCQGSAEATGLPDDCADAVIAATAWHWFDASRAIVEVDRLLRPEKGGLGLLWNLFDESIPWVAAYADITYRRRPARTPSARDGSWRRFFEILEGWQPLREVRIPNPQRTDPERLIERLTSSSVIASLSAAEQVRVRAEGREVLRAHGLAERSELTLPYVTLVCWTRRAEP